MEPETDPAKALKNFKEGLLSIEKKVRGPWLRGMGPDSSRRLRSQFRTLTKKNGGIGILLLAQ